jgi:hypothetical protein
VRESARCLDRKRSLLLLLGLGQLRLLGLIKKLGPLLVCGKLLVGRKYSLRRGHSNSNLQLGLGFPLHHPHRGWNVRIIATDCSANVLLTREFVNGWIETHPAPPREQCFDPCMGRAVGRGMCILRAVIKVPTDVATRNPGIPDECDHDVSKILTHALP